ncbi:MAG: tetratricopeptide repeat protein [Stellaceae bacterium]
MSLGVPNGLSADSASALGRARELMKAGRAGEAEAICRGILQSRPEDAPALHLLGVLAHRRGDNRAALALVERAASRPEAPGDCFVTLTQIHQLEGRLDQALTAGREAVRRRPGAPQALFSLGAVHVERAELADAAMCFRQALSLDPNFAPAHLELGHILLLTGDFQAGWIEYQWRFSLEDTRHLIPPFRVPQWDGRELPHGRILLIGDQGYGDTIQFARYIPAVAERCAEVLIGCSPELLPLIGAIRGAGRSFVRWEHIPPFDAYCALSSLPGLFKTDLGSIPASVPYLACDPEIARRWAERLASACVGSRLRVGIAWAGRPSHPRDRQRSARWADLAPLTRLSGVSLASLQKEVPAPDRPELARATGLIDLGQGLADFSETAGVLGNLDLVVTVDTSLAHLAGALGKPVWLMLPRVPDWRWMLGREDSPWYPTARLFRQDARGEWAGVIERVARELRAVLDGDRGRLLPPGSR